MEQQIEKELWEEFQNEIKQKPKIDLSKLPLKKFPEHKLFWEAFLNEKFPEGEINKILEKNFAVWVLVNNIDLERIKQKYIDQGWNPRPFFGWIKKVLDGSIINYNPYEINTWIQMVAPHLFPLFKNKVVTISENKEIKLLWDKDLANYQEEKVDWIVKNMIKTKSIIILGGKRSTLKSWLCLNLGYAVANGSKFLDNFECAKSNVLYLDRENGFSELKIRSLLMKNGLELNNTENKIAFLSESYIKIDSYLDLPKIEQIIKDNEIKLVIVDTYRRFISFDENDAGDVSKLFVDMLKPLCEKTGAAIILIHHEKKGESTGDEMDMLRGSSDLANYVDGVIQIERKGNSLILKQTKNRSGKELEPFKIKVDTDEINYFKFIYSGNLESIETQIAKELVKWMLLKELNSFTYTQAKDYAESKGYKKNKIVDALMDLQNKGIIEKGGERMPYKVILGKIEYYE